MAAIFEIYFALLLLNQKTNLSCNQVSDTWPSWPSCFVLVFSVLLTLRLPRFGKRALILFLFVRLFDLRLFGFVCYLLVFWRAAACDCDTPWTFLLPFLIWTVQKNIYLQWFWHSVFVKSFFLYMKIGYKVNGIRQTVCMVNTITVNNVASLFGCTPAGLALDSLTAPA